MKRGHDPNFERITPKPSERDPDPAVRLKKEAEERRVKKMRLERSVRARKKYRS